MYNDKITSMLKRFLVNGVVAVPKQITFEKDFWAVMKATFSGIHGSGPSWVVRRKHPTRPELSNLTWLPNNLNIAIGVGTRPEWHTYLTDLGAGAPVRRDVYPTASEWVVSRWEYTVVPVRVYLRSDSGQFMLTSLRAGAPGYRHGVAQSVSFRECARERRNDHTRADDSPWLALVLVP
jgi:hypothetical protein